MAKTRLKLRDIHGDGIIQCQVYLKKAVGLLEQFPDNTEEWNDIRRYQRLRNIIVHNDGLVPNGFGEKDDNNKSNRDLLAFVNTRNSISLLEETRCQKRIQLDGDFCLEFLDTLERFFDQLRPCAP